jgi:hypothetical protein
MSIRVTVKIPNLQAAAERAAEKASTAVFAEMFARFQAAIGAKIWEWPNTTERRDGSGKVREVVGSPRNIVNLGLLRASGFYQKVGKTSALFTWAAGYATATHEGAQLRNGGFIPPRPWTDVVLGRIQGAARIKPYDAGERMAELFARYFSV